MFLRLMVVTLILTPLVVVLTLFPVNAAPIWVERNFVAPNKLIDEVFTRSNDQSTIVIDHSEWGRFLSKYARARDDGLNVVDYRGVSPEDAMALDVYIESLSAIDVTTLNKDEQLAFWINMYNAVTVQLIIKSDPVDSIRDLNKPWDRPRVEVNGVSLTLNQIESGIIRPVYDDPRIHYAVNCASIGCPNLALMAYSGSTLDDMLDAGARNYINHPRGVSVKGRRVIASKIFGWYREDFGADVPAVLDHIRKYADDDLKASLEGRTKISKYIYDWNLNDRNAASAK